MFQRVCHRGEAWAAAGSRRTASSRRAEQSSARRPLNPRLALPLAGFSLVDNLAQRLLA